MSNRMTDFRKRQAKEDVANYEKQQAQINKLWELVLALSGRVFKLEKDTLPLLGRTSIIAKRSEFRSLAMLQILTEEGGRARFVENVAERAEKLLLDVFERESAEEDLAKGLVPADEEPATDGHFATFSLKFFNLKDNKELFTDNLPRGKVEIGQAEVFPELDEQLKGMKVGETKTFPLTMEGQTDTAELHLISLKKRKATDAPKPDAPPAAH